MTNPNVLLRGSDVGLGMARADMLHEYHRWENDPSVILGFGTQLPQSWETRSAGYSAQAGSSERQARFEVVRIEDDQSIGMTTLLVDHHVRTAEYIILLALEAQGKGYATEATRPSLYWAFKMAALRSVWLKVLTPNTAAIRAYKRAGFQEAGQLRQAGYWLGEPCGEMLMDAVPADLDEGKIYFPEEDRAGDSR
jgi:diamine N-acetyltransferase